MILTSNLGARHLLQDHAQSGEIAFSSVSPEAASAVMADVRPPELHQTTEWANH
jgi:hypothetical protein